MDRRTQIPLKQMAWKAKHEDHIFKQIYKKFTYGKSIEDERHILAKLNENMIFKGGPRDKKYK